MSQNAKNMKQKIISHVVTGFLMGAAPAGLYAADQSGGDAKGERSEKNACSGKNGCGAKKGKHKSADANSCSGKNGCQGKTGKKKKDADDKNACSGPNGCGQK
jgi:hypothetical protein